MAVGPSNFQKSGVSTGLPCLIPVNTSFLPGESKYCFVRYITNYHSNSPEPVGPDLEKVASGVSEWTVWKLGNKKYKQNKRDICYKEIGTLWKPNNFVGILQLKIQ